MNLLLTQVDGKKALINWSNVGAAQPYKSGSIIYIASDDYAWKVVETLEEIYQMLERKPEFNFCQACEKPLPFGQSLCEECFEAKQYAKEQKEKLRQFR